MKLARLLALAACTASVASASQVLLHDDFDGATVDASKWTIMNPVIGSSVTQSGGELTTIKRGTLATVANFSAPYAISGSFTSNSFDELFTVTLRSDLSEAPTFSGRQGVSVTFGDANNTLSLYAIDGDGVFTSLAADVPFSFSTGVSYAFEITDDGQNVAVSINGIERISGSTDLALGGKVAFYSREWSGTSSSMDSVTITSAIPEPASFAALAGLGVLGLAAARRRRVA